MTSGRQDEAYLGDGVYASHDGWMIRMDVDRGGPKERTVWLEPAALDALVRYAQRHLGYTAPGGDS